MRLELLAAAMLVSTGAAAQGAADVYKGRVKPGLYEIRSETVMKGVPGVAPGQEKSTETKKGCISVQEIARGFEVRKECKPKVNNATPASVQMVYECDGQPQEFHLKVVPGGHETRLVANDMTPDKKPYTMTMTTQWKYLGACPTK